MKSLLHIVLVLLCLTPITSAHAADDMEGMHSKMAMSKETAPAVPDKDAYAQAMKTMHENMMAVTPTGDVDVDFMQSMIPHHQGAIDMAKVVLEKGNDPQVKKLAQAIIGAQEREITFMKAWLAKHQTK